MRIEENTLSKLQAAFWKQEFLKAQIEVLRANLNKVANDADLAFVQFRSLLQVVNNQLEIKLGETHVWDVDTGEVTELPKKPEVNPT